MQRREDKGETVILMRLAVQSSMKLYHQEELRWNLSGDAKSEHFMLIIEYNKVMMG